jgi:hypothetical protein
MNCPQINSRLVTYLHGEVSPSEVESIRAHLAVCTICQGELQILSDLEIRIARHLTSQAEQVHPAQQAWNTFHARISPEGLGKSTAWSRTIYNRFFMQKQATRRLILVVMIILALILAAPPTWTLAARIGDWVGSWFYFVTPGTECSMGIGNFNDFTPYAPHYLPEGFDCGGTGGTTAPGFVRLELTYSRDDQFVTLLQSKGPGLEDLPPGSLVQVNGETGEFVRVFATSSEALQQKISSIPIIKNLDYGVSSLLVWRIGEIDLVLVSNLPQGEILKIARSLVPAENSEGQIHPN